MRADSILAKQNLYDFERVAFAKKSASHKPGGRNALLAVFIAMAFLLTSVSSIALNAKAAEERIFVIAMGEGVNSANPFIGLYDSDYMLYSYIYDGLTTLDQDGNVAPSLAKSWRPLSGSEALATGSSFTAEKPASMWPLGSIWEYELCRNVTWSDGIPFDADDVVFTYELQIGDNYATFWAYQPVTKWIDHVEKVDQYNFRCYFADISNNSRPPVSIAWADIGTLFIMPKHILKDLSPATIGQNWTGIPAIGTGPFIPTDILEDEIIAKEKVTLVKNPEWEKGFAKEHNLTCEIDKLVMKFYSEEQTLMLDLKTKKIDATEIQPLSYVAMVQNASEKPPELNVVPMYSTTVYTKISHFNFNKNAPGDLNPARCDPALLRATGIATNRDIIVEDIFKGLGTPGVGLLTPVTPKYYYNVYEDHENISWFNVTNGYNESDPSYELLYSYHAPMAHIMDYDVVRANEILNASGYDWPTYPEGYRVVGQLAADRLYRQGVVGDPQFAMKDQKGNTRYLSFEDIVGEGVYEDIDTSKYLGSFWKAIGVELKTITVGNSIWNQLVYNFREDFTETYWSGDPDPNYLLYVPSSYAMDGWNEWGPPEPWYDYCYKKQASILEDYDTVNSTTGKVEYGRIHWVHECEKSLYLQGGGFLTTCCPKNCYAFNDWRWTNWGDIEAHPGLQFDHYWGETPLFMEVKWVGSGNSMGGIAEIILAISIVAVLAAVPVVITIRRRKARKIMTDEEGEKESKENV